MTDAPTSGWLFRSHPQHGCGRYVVIFDQPALHNDREYDDTNTHPNYCPHCKSNQLVDQQTSTTVDYTDQTGTLFANTFNQE